MKTKFTKISVLLAGLILLAGATSTANAQAAVGDKFKAGALYYKIIKLSPAQVEVAPQNAAAPVWNEADKPTGAITIPSTVSYGTKTYNATRVGTEAFRGCAGITSVIIPAGVTSIGHRAFNNCTEMTSVAIPEGVQYLHQNCFSTCSKLSSVTIPSSIVSGGVGGVVFSGCTGLTEINSKIADPTNVISSGAPGAGFNFYNVPKTIPLYVPVGSLALYQAAAEWKDFTNIIEKNFTRVAATPAEQGITVTTSRGAIGIELPRADNVLIHTVSGRLLHRQPVSAGGVYTFAVPAGVYVVSAGGASQKVVVK